MLGKPATGLTITNPLIKYRALVATKAISPDHGQLRLAVHLQKLYDRLKDYEPQVEYSQRLGQISRAIGSRTSDDGGGELSNETNTSFRRSSTWRALWQKKEQRDTLALTRRLTSREAALELSSPRGLMVHGEVGSGKSMLIDLFADCLPNRKKRRWHFNTFMLETIAKLETFRVNRARDQSITAADVPQTEDNYSLLWLARDMIQTSPILFLDEFQMPDRVASKILINLMTSFFHLGGVLIATSNRMPEELAQASGVEFVPPPSRLNMLGQQLGLSSRSRGSNSGLYYGQNEFVAFLEVLKARCEVWEMDSTTDYRRVESKRSAAPSKVTATEWRLDDHADLQHGAGMVGWPVEADREELTAAEQGHDEQLQVEAPTYYHVAKSEDEQTHSKSYAVALQEATGQIQTESIQFVPEALNVYGRSVPVPRTCNGVSEWTFAELCKSTLGPADYITIASRYHTLIVRDIPILTWLMKNEARRFITLLDALYECRCKLYIHDAAAGPDDIFFPDQDLDKTADGDDSVYSETISEVFQDATAPFRPNVLTNNPDYAEPDYTHAHMAGFTHADATQNEGRYSSSNDGATKNRSHNDPFGRSYGRSDAAMDRPPVDPDEPPRRGPDFSKTSAFTGEDEMFAYRRAQSRLWELCGRRWWARNEADWHRPLPADVRRWERASGTATAPTAARGAEDMIPLGRRPVNSDGTSDVRIGDAVVDESRNAQLFRDGASPFRTTDEPPPSFGGEHAWGMVTWGRKAGAWGKGVEGLKERKPTKA